MIRVHNNFLAVVFAFASALTIAVGTVWRHQIIIRHDRHAADSANGSGSTHSTLGALRKPTWWMSLTLAWVAYGFQAVALAFGSLLVVQPVLVLSLLMTLLLAARVEGRRMEVDETFWATVLTAAVGVLVILGRPLPGSRQPANNEWLIAVGAGVAVIALVIFAARALSHLAATRAFLLGAACGAIFGYLAVFSKTAVDEFVAGGMMRLATTWPVYALLAAAVVGTLVQQYAFSAGNLAQSLPAMKIFEPLLAYLLGLVLLGESFDVSTPVGWALMAVAVLAMFAATFMLSRKPV